MTFCTCRACTNNKVYNDRSLSRTLAFRIIVIWLQKTWNSCSLSRHSPNRHLINRVGTPRLKWPSCSFHLYQPLFYLSLENVIHTDVARSPISAWNANPWSLGDIQPPNGRAIIPTCAAHVPVLIVRCECVFVSDVVVAYLKQISQARESITRVTRYQ